MAMCSDCEKLVGALKDVPAHEALKQQSVEKYKGTGWHTATLTSYICEACGTEWSCDRDKQDDHAGWAAKH